MRALIERLLAIDQCESIYQQAQRLAHGSIDARLVAALGLRIEVAALDLKQIPATGPLVVAANHPHGAIDGLALATVVRRVRSDVRVLANGLMARIPEMTALCFFVDPFGGRDAAAQSLAGLRAAHRWLQQGGALIVFPSGEVAHRRLPDGSHGESPWQTTAARLGLATGATLVPAFIEGGNSRWFYAAGRIHPRLRTALLPRELLNARGTTITVRFASAMRQGTFQSASAATNGLIAAIEGVRARPAPSTIESEILALKPDTCLLEEGGFQVFCSPAHAIPRTLEEIGRLRAETYRSAGEGTGAAIDLDAFDRDYLHLFVWDRRDKLVVGAYRLGETERLSADRGVDALYTRTLFRYDVRLLDRIGPALELGRAFVRKEYQKSHSALLLLWKGIGRFIVRHPQYRVLFGPVSISPRFSTHSQKLMMAFLEQNHRDHGIASLVEALNPPAPALSPSACDTPGAPELPVLLRQYLKLNARLVGFNVDAGFGNTLDALMMVDLCAVARPILNRYLGREGAATFLAAHRQPAAA
jgi:putative hemolysin